MCVQAAVKDPAGRGKCRLPDADMHHVTIGGKTAGESSVMEKVTVATPPPHNQYADRFASHRTDDDAKDASQRRRTSLKHGL